MYTISKQGKIYTVLSPSQIVQFSSLERANCSRWIVSAGETQEERENKFVERPPINENV